MFLFLKENKNNIFLKLNVNRWPNALVGEKETHCPDEVTKRTVLDELLDYYPDGRPTQLTYSLGDFMVTSENAKMEIILRYCQKIMANSYIQKRNKESTDSLNISYLEQYC